MHTGATNAELLEKINALTTEVHALNIELAKKESEICEVKNTTNAAIDAAVGKATTIMQEKVQKAYISGMEATKTMLKDMQGFLAR